MDFYTILTDSAKNTIANSYAEKVLLTLEEFAVGDGGDGYYDIESSQTSLVNETYRGEISSIYIDEEYENRIILECAIPSDSGGYYIREVGIFDVDKNLFAIGRLPESYKPVEDEGSTRDFYIKVVLEVENLENIELVVNPNVSLISLEYLESNHNKDVNAHYRLIDADKVDGFHAGNEENQVGVSNNQRCVGLNADKVDGYHAGNEANELLVLDEDGVVPEANLKPYASKEHTHELSEIITSESLHSTNNMHIESGSNSGTTSYVYPPEGFTMDDLLAFIPSIRNIYFSGDVDSNDSLYCYWSKETTCVKVVCYNSEQRATPQVNWLAIWRKN